MYTFLKVACEKKNILKNDMRKYSKLIDISNVLLNIITKNIKEEEHVVENLSETGVIHNNKYKTKQTLKNIKCE